MKNFSDTLTFTLPLGSSAHDLAKKFWRQHSDRQQAKQVYLNSLAVYAVNFYLHCMGIKTDWEASFSWNPVMQTLADVADLEIPNVGKLECRPVLPQALVVTIPPEVWSNRIGYVAVQLDESLKRATLLGFSETAGTGELPIDDLRSLEDLLAHLTAKTSQSKIQNLKSKTQLSQWFENLFEAGWQSIETILGSKQQNLAFSLRSNSNSSNSTIKRAKLIDLGLQLENQSLALLVAITPETEEKLSILVQVHPMEEESYLPPNLQLMMLSASGEILQKVGSRSVDNYIQLKRFRGLPGESFAIQLTFGEVSVTEDFVI
jgi:Protein of unknown function (DUF1822)